MTADHTEAKKPTPEYLNKRDLLKIITDDPKTWYTHPTFVAIVDTCFWGESSSTDEARAIRLEVSRFMAKMIQEQRIEYGNRPRDFNDDDRWHSEMIQKFPCDPSKETRQPEPDTVIFHHSSLPPGTSLAELNALQMFRLYAREHRNNPFFKPNGQYQGMDSGHYRDVQLFPEQDIEDPLFFGYHHLVYPDGTSIRLLDDTATAFNAGEYLTNCRGIGIAIHDELQNKRPSRAVLEEVARIARSYNPKYVIGHREVMIKTDDGLVPIVRDCPGDLFNGENGWKQELLEFIGLPDVKTVHPYVEE